VAAGDGSSGGSFMLSMEASGAVLFRLNIVGVEDMLLL
jgi:hypothetical protein